MTIKTFLSLAFVVFILVVGCSVIPKSFKERTLDDIYPILTEGQYDTLKSLTGDNEINEFLDQFWKQYAGSDSAYNELRAEYGSRVEYANFYFPDRHGWGRSHQKRIFLIHGPPDYIERTGSADIQVGSVSRIMSLEVWQYLTQEEISSKPALKLHPGQKRFVFADFVGGGFYVLLYSSEDIADIDVRLFDATLASPNRLTGH